MKHSTGNPTKAEQDRIEKFRWIGCVVSLVYLKIADVPYDVHHLVEGGSRLGHLYTIPLSPWHHRGVVPLGRSALEMTERFGPSKALSPQAFAARFGSDHELLEMTNALIAAHERAMAA